jgi:hypothetical protein
MIPENHLLKKIDVVVDFGFIFDLVEESYCLNFGRPANEPEVLFKLLFIQYLDKLSDERIVSEALRETWHTSGRFTTLAFSLLKVSPLTLPVWLPVTLMLFYFQFLQLSFIFL